MIAENIRFELLKKPYDYVDFLKKKLTQLTQDFFLECEDIYMMQRNTILKIRFRCFRHPKECKIKYVVFLDLKSKLARIYYNEKGHNTDYFHGSYKRCRYSARVNIFDDFFIFYF